ncbi:uncharacterized protein Z518_10567 [Rhinocladiella mackenziei CBS 650.93]|uniref:DNA excision repair protein ERCC-8 n=1 Tax=Rhinocladiella mackenziei CBS 650.93 TaxID=1442369 RepID=A0A0D2GQ29_9EURO|nr:uncharacterized protein Z518_10567 [Rhinocladiella mackenziei CBS 650.93]KIX00428.1 hypothetical protein Z518_10567 [Rhinocladiella mackenziei CBS 650.93]
MNQAYLGKCLGTVSSPSFRRSHNGSLVDRLAHRKNITFASTTGHSDSRSDNAEKDTTFLVRAHQAGVNCLTVDNNNGRYLLSGGADSCVRLWDLEEYESKPQTSSVSKTSRTYTSKASLTRRTPSSHAHALTSISIYPFDPTPSTLLTTSYDKTLKVTSITPTSLLPVHGFELDFIPYTHSLSPLPDSSPLIAVGTEHPSIRLLDLRSGLSTHSLSGPNGAIYTLAWSPRISYILASGSADGRVLFYDIRRANAAFASLDLDDAIGVVGERPSTGLAARSELLDFNTLAHNGPVTSVQWTPSGDRLVTAGHDQRIRVWDSATGRNELVHFGPRIRNERQGELKPLISPAGTHSPGRESLFWPNDDGRGVIFQHHLREGHLLRILRTEGVNVSDVRASKRSGVTSGKSSASNIARLTSAGRINGMVWRVNAPTGDGVEMYTAHGDGRICAWMPIAAGPHDDDDDDGEEVEVEVQENTTADDAENRKKRKRDLITDLVEGLAKKSAPFS